MFRPEAWVLEATPQATARFDHARSRYQRIRISLCFLTNPAGTRVTGASRAAITSRPAARVLEAKPQGTGRFDRATGRCQEPSVSQKPHGHTNNSCELRLRLPRQASKPTPATPEQHIVLEGPWDLVTTYTGQSVELRHRLSRPENGAEEGSNDTPKRYPNDT